jgi:hypothetical protein
MKRLRHNTVRYHIQLSKHRTTVSVDKIISDLMAIKLKTEPGTPEAHQVVREQLEEFIAHDRGRPGDQLSRYITNQAILYLLDKRLSDKYLDYILGE